MSKRSIAAIACAVLMLGIALWEIVATLAAGVPGDEAWARAAKVVRDAHRPGDLIVFAPRWVDPTGRMHLGDLIPIEMAARMDDARYARIWELSIRGAHRDEPAAFEQEVDGVLVRRYDRTPATVRAEVLPAQLAVAEVGFEPHRCIHTSGPVKATLPAGTLVGYAGIADVFTRRENRAAGKLDVEIDGKVVASIAPGVDDGWVRFETKIPAGEVTFVSRARPVCFAAEVRE
jgi:hypothetical protein